MNKTGQSSIGTIITAFEACKAKGVKPTQKNIAIESGLSVRTIKRHWANVNDKDRVTPQLKQGDTEHKKTSNRVTLKSGFERFKQRANSTPTTFTSFTIDKL